MELQVASICVVVNLVSGDDNGGKSLPVSSFH